MSSNACVLARPDRGFVINVLALTLATALDRGDSGKPASMPAIFEALMTNAPSKLEWLNRQLLCQLSAA